MGRNHYCLEVDTLGSARTMSLGVFLSLFCFGYISSEPLWLSEFG